MKILLLFLLLMGPALALTADELVTRNLEARGGLQALVGRYVGGGGFEPAYTSLVKRLGKLRNEVTLQGGAAITASDGGTTFQPVFDQQPVQSIGARSRHAWRTCAS